ncbi:MAG: nucleoside-diphosphate kinase [Planctomycetes bacterium]|nr:nucleoside-diphosphate kinase [Planctomycetota bacterium]MCC7172087.1 nucleoside-diphosphate kinase [Planctomycetota bacterium]
MERTLIILKPDAIQRQLAGAILGRFETKGLKIVGTKFTQIPRATLEKHYADHKGKPFYEGLVSFMAKSPVLVLALEGKNAIAICRKMMGATFGSKAEPGTIRGDYGISDSFNLIHGSDSPAAAEKELALFFQPGELVQYDLIGAGWIYDADELK